MVVENNNQYETKNRKIQRIEGPKEKETINLLEESDRNQNSDR